jgi:hypothetical protein
MLQDRFESDKLFTDIRKRLERLLRPTDLSDEQG